MNNRAEYRKELRSYVAGLVLAVLLSAAAFGSVAWGGWSRVALLWIIGICAGVQIGVHFRFFLHIDLSRSKRDDLQLILFSCFVVLLLAGGTIWILANLRARML
jgi:cytochrome o ubiquinol oxidase operon protein cyoD